MNNKDYDSTNGEKNIETDEGSSLNLNYLNSLLSGDQSDLKEYLRHSLKDIENIQSKYSLVMREKDPEAIRDLVHKARWIFKMLDQPHLTKHMEKCKEMINNIDNYSSSEMEKEHKKGAVMLNQTILNIKHYIDE